MTPYTPKPGGVRIGSRYEPQQRRQDTTASEDRVQEALLAWHSRSANDSRILGTSRDLHSQAALQRIERERHRARRVRRWRRVWRDVARYFMGTRP